MISTVEEALALRESGFAQFCMGEVDGQAPAGFDFGNSPFEVSNVNFSGKSIVQRTSAGTQGIVAARHAERLYATSLVTASATARALLSSAPSRISLVAMGNNAVVRADEYELCALHLRNLLEDRRGDAHAVRQVILAGGDALRFHDPSRPHLDRRDLDIALDVDRYDLAIRTVLEGGRPVARAEIIV
jgi:2-phosphosulfolactate phosphatase